MTSENIKCPKCGAMYDEISDVQDMQGLLGINETDKQWMCNNCSHLFNQKAEKDYSSLLLDDLAHEILRQWKDMPHKAFVYADAMTKLTDINDNLGFESGGGIVNGFLLNARGWIGEVATKIKEELKIRLDEQNISNQNILKFVEIYEDAMKNNQTAIDLDIDYDSSNKSFYYNGIQITKNSVADNLGDEVAEKILKWIKK